MMPSLLEQLVVPDIPDISKVPTQDDLPCDDGVPMETYRHKRQMDLLIDVLDPWLEARGDGFASGNMFLYYSLLQVKRKDFMGPDFFVALNVPMGERKSWVCWEEGKVPDVVVELLSASTAKYDKTGKKDLYARVVKVPEYFWYDPWNPEDFAGFILYANQYQPLNPTPEGRFYSAQLDLYLGRWEGRYKGIDAVWMRWFTSDGEMLPSGDEITEATRQKAEAAEAKAEAAEAKAEAAEQNAEAAKARAEAAEHRAEAEAQRAAAEQAKADNTSERLRSVEKRAEKMAAKLRELGVDIDK